MTLFQSVYLAVFFTGTAIAGNIYYTTCGEESQNACTINQVSIEPCNDPNSCALKKGRPATLSFDFTPNFSTSNLKTGLFWSSDLFDLPFNQLHEADGCLLTSCPLERGKSQGGSYSLHINKKIPVRKYVVKFKLWNEDNQNQVCCFKTEVTLYK